MAIKGFIWTAHAELRLGDRGLGHLDIEQVIRENPRLWIANQGDADWRVEGTRPDERRFIAIFDHPALGDPALVRIVSVWTLRNPSRS